MDKLKKIQPLIDVLCTLKEDRDKRDRYYLQEIEDLEQQRKEEISAKNIAIHAVRGELQKMCPHPDNKLVYVESWSYHKNVDEGWNECEICGEHIYDRPASKRIKKEREGL